MFTTKFSRHLLKICKINLLKYRPHIGQERNSVQNTCKDKNETVSGDLRLLCSGFLSSLKLRSTFDLEDLDLHSTFCALT